MDLKAFQSKYEHKPVVENNNRVPKNPMLSVCVQTYQHVDFIEACLEGILQQKTNFEFEILLGEDASTDGTRELCEKYAKQYPDKMRLFLHHRENNIKIGGNPTGRFNFVNNLFSARGKYIALCEGDDYWTDPYKLQRQVDFLEANPAFSSCFHPVQILKGNEFVEGHITRKIPDVTSTKDLLKGNFIHTPSVVFRNHFETQNMANFIRACEFSPIGDLLLHVFNAQFGKIYQLADTMAVYRLESGIWSSLAKEVRIKNTIKAYLSLVHLLHREEDFEALIVQIEKYFYQLHKLSEAKTPKKALKLEEISIKTHLQVVLRKLKQKLLL